MQVLQSATGQRTCSCLAAAAARSGSIASASRAVERATALHGRTPKWVQTRSRCERAGTQWFTAGILQRGGVQVCSLVMYVRRAHDTTACVLRTTLVSRHAHDQGLTRCAFTRPLLFGLCLSTRSGGTWCGSGSTLVSAERVSWCRQPAALKREAGALREAPSR